MPDKRVVAPRTFKRTGLHRLNCPACDGYGYFVVAKLERALERHGRLPGCECGHEYEPDRMELSEALGLEHWASDEFGRRVDVKLAAQRPHAYLGHRCADVSVLNDRAMSELEAEQLAQWKQRRVSGLKRGAVSLIDRAVAAADIPF